MSSSLDKHNEASLGVLTKALAATTSGVLITDPGLPDNPIIYVNEGFVRMTGYSKEDVVGKNCRFLQGEDTSEESVDRLREAIKGQKECKVTLRNYRKDGSMFWNELSVSPVYEGEKLTHFIGVQTHVTEREEMSRLQSSLDLGERISRFFKSEDASSAIHLGSPRDHTCV